MENIALRSSQILYIFVLRAIKITIFEPEVVIFPTRNTKIYKICELRSAIIIFHILQHFATKLCSFTYSKMRFPAVVLDFVLLA